MAPATHDALPVLDRSGDIPLHAQVAAMLRGYIRTNKLAAGAVLPSEAALCERFGVARSVVRQALAALAAEGMIQRETGRPATVAAPQEHRRLVQRSTGLYEQFAQSGVSLQTRVLALGRAEPPADVAGFFGTSRLLMLERLRHVAEAPLAYVRTWLPADAVPGLRAEHLVDASLHGVLTRQFGLRPGAGRNQIRAVAADAALAELLDTQAGTPLLMLQGQGMDQHGKPLEWFTTWHRAEQLVFDVDVSMGHESVQPRLQDAAVQADALPGGQDPLARAQALVAELSAELARLRGQS
ncbi:HTH-type transcriptional repressor DasR [compost metagenome]|uniref:GntR family transcriptional regulator n=1 Tax=Achromobacter sp. Root83 TaxID=1736602 RepID=UPI00070F3A7B|nr:GntR family transcriptional regulator [Achromobacter sp. Root83]KRC85483.1 GntR family transcriptional regulator [Achromobacter sp. Root83]